MLYDCIYKFYSTHIICLQYSLQIFYKLFLLYIKKRLKIIITNLEPLFYLTILFLFTSAGAWLYIQIRKLCSWHWWWCMTRMISSFTIFSYIAISHSTCGIISPAIVTSMTMRTSISVSTTAE